MASQDAVNRLQHYVQRVSETGEIVGSDKEELEGYTDRLTKTLHSLQNQVMQHEATLEKSRTSEQAKSIDAPSPDPRKRLQQVRAITAAYRKLISTEPTLPSPESPLPALLALRITLNLIEESKQTIRETHTRLAEANAEFGRESQSLNDARYLTSALEERIQRLRNEQDDHMNQSAQDIAGNLVAEQLRRKSHYAKELRGMVRAFNRFVKERLALMLAAEDLGGPIVGDDLSLDENVLKAGFTQKGQRRTVDMNGDGAQEKRSRRNEEIWDLTGNYIEARSGVERDAAAASFRNLTESLLNAAASGGESTPYIAIDKETAAVRFLVRAKVAQFHPKDATKLALQGFDLERET